MRKTLIAAGLTAVALTVAASAMAGPGRGPGGGYADRGGAMFERFDADGDGRVTPAEVQSMLDDRRNRFDADGDGALTLDEFQGLWVATARPRMVDRFQALDADGDGRVTEAEFEARASRMMRLLDRDGDGAIAPQDRAAAVERFGARGAGRGGCWN